MTAQAEVAPVTQAADLRRSTRWLAALLLPVGPAAVGLLRYVLPYATADSSAETVAAVRADPGAESVVLWLSLVAILTLVPAAIWVGRLTRRHAPRLTAAALILLVPGYLSMAWLIAPDLMLWSGVDEGVDPATMIRLFESTHPTAGIAIGLFVLGHVFGTILLGLGLWRSRAVPRWAALLAILSQPVHFVAAVIVVSPSLDLAGWGMQAVAFGVAAIAILRLTDGEWDLAPAIRPATSEGRRP